MPWVVLHIDCERGHHEALEQALLDHGAAAVTLADGADQPLFEPALGETPLWQHIRISGLFDGELDIDAIMSNLRARYESQYPGRYQTEILEDKDWVRSWMDDYQPIHVGQRLWICPSWKEPPEPGAVNLILDPGMAFGTGTHPTTLLCLQWLDALYLDAPRDHHVIDYGCGSGILAIAALLLGAGTADGVDIDPQALRTARENAERNSLEAAQLKLMLPDHASRLNRANVVLANILAGPLVTLAPTLMNLVKPGGQLVLSGILQSQADQVMASYTQVRFNAPEILDGWALLSGTRISAR